MRLTDEEVCAIATHLHMTVEAFTDQYTRLTSDRRGLSLTEHADQSCIFLTEDNRCAIEAVKPQQCSDFPHKWVFDGVEEVCEGMGKTGGEN